MNQIYTKKSKAKKKVTFLAFSKRLEFSSIT